MDRNRFPRLRAMHLPTPLEPLDRLSAHLGGPRIWIKRDDCTGLATGGNKSRKLDYLIADAIQEGATTIITQGAIQSNHVRQSAAIAAKMGLGCSVVLEERVQSSDPSFTVNGNILLDRLFGARITIAPRNSDAQQIIRSIADDLSSRGERPYIIPTGGSNAIGAIGYVDAADEFLQQAGRLDLATDEIVHATGSAGTQAGLVVGLLSLESRIPVLGVSVGKPREQLEPIVLELAQQTADRIGWTKRVPPEAVRVDSRFVGEGYGLPTPAMIGAIKLVARLEGILLDPVYTGKAMAGLIDRIRNGQYRTARNIVFWHTGGSAGLFGQPAIFGQD